MCHKEEIEFESTESLEYLQWYEADTERYELEVNAISGIGFMEVKLKDGRVSFYREPREDCPVEIAVVCDWLYPRKPPGVHVKAKRGVSEKVKSWLKGLKKLDDGSVDVIPEEEVWKTEMMVSLIEWLLEGIEVVLVEGAEASMKDGDFREDCGGCEA